MGCCYPVSIYYSVLFVYGKNEKYYSTLRFHLSLIRKLVGNLPSQDGSNYHIVMGNFFTSRSLLRLLKEVRIAANRTIRIICEENDPLKPVKKMEKIDRGYPDVVIEEHIKKDNKSHIFRHLHSTITCFDSYNSLSFKIIDKANCKFDLKIKETLHISWTKPNLNAQQNHLALTLSL